MRTLWRRSFHERREKIAYKNLFTRDPVLQRKLRKQLLYRMPLRPLLMFFALYVVKMGFLDGAAGFHYSVLRSFYEYMINLKITEHNIRRKGKGF